MFAIVLLTLTSIHIFSFQEISAIVWNFAGLIFVIGTLFILPKSLARIHSKKIPLIIAVYYTGLFIASISSIAYKQQTPYQAFFHFVSNSCYLMMYFHLIKQESKVDRLLKLIKYFSAIYCIIYIIQYAAYPKLIFTQGGFLDRGTIRFRIEGVSFLFLATMVYFYEYINTKKIAPLLWVICNIVIIAMHGFRSHILAALVCFVYISIRSKKIRVIHFLVSIAVMIMLYGVLYQTTTMIKDMTDLTIEEFSQGTDNVRLIAFSEYVDFISKFPNAIYTGIGVAGPNGVLSNSIEALANDGFYYVDLGLIGYTLIAGPLTVIAILFYIGYGVFSNSPEKEKIIAGAYFLLLILTSITSMEAYRTGSLGIQAIGLYFLTDRNGTKK